MNQTQNQINLKYFFSSQKMIIVTSAFLVFFTVGFLFLYAPLYKQFKEKTALYKQESLKLESIKKEISLSGKFGTKIVTDAQGLSAALDELTKKANALDFKFQSIKQSEPLNLNANFKIMPISIEATCHYKALAKFLASLENLTQSVMMVDSLEVTRQKDQQPNLNVGLNLGMYLLLYKDE